MILAKILETKPIRVKAIRVKVDLFESDWFFNIYVFKEKFYLPNICAEFLPVNEHIAIQSLLIERNSYASTSFKTFISFFPTQYSSLLL